MSREPERSSNEQPENGIRRTTKKLSIQAFAYLCVPLREAFRVSCSLRVRLRQDCSFGLRASLRAGNVSVNLRGNFQAKSVERDKARRVRLIVRLGGICLHRCDI